MKGIQKPGVKHKILWVVLMVIINSGEAFAEHPLITDDTGTQGKGKFQLEINGQYGYDNESVASDAEVANGVKLVANEKVEEKGEKKKGIKILSPYLGSISITGGLSGKDVIFLR